VFLTDVSEVILAEVLVNLPPWVDEAASVVAEGGGEEVIDPMPVSSSVKQ